MSHLPTINFQEICWFYEGYMPVWFGICILHFSDYMFNHQNSTSPMDPLGWVSGSPRTLPLFWKIRYRVYQHCFPVTIKTRRKGAQSQSTLFFFQPGRRSCQASGEGSNSKKIQKSLDVQTPAENLFGHLPKTPFSGGIWKSSVWKARNLEWLLEKVTVRNLETHWTYSKT